MKTIDGEIRLQKRISDMYVGQYIYINTESLDSDELKYLRKVAGWLLVPDEHGVTDFIKSLSDTNAELFNAIMSGKKLLAKMMYQKARD